MQQATNVWPLPAGVQVELEKWFDRFEAGITQPLHSGYQGGVWFFEHPDLNLAIKAVSNSGFGKILLKHTLRHEHGVYKKLFGLDGIPRCYGLFRDRFLVLEHIQGETLRQARLADRDLFYRKFFDLLQSIHARDVAHFDLKRKNNIMVMNGNQPFLIDFGTAVIYKRGFMHFVNHFLFRLAMQFDLNAWVKHKYKRQIDQVSPEDMRYFRRTLFEAISARIKRFYKQRIKSRLKKISTVK
jgi:serine/threonine protein kinase